MGGRKGGYSSTELDHRGPAQSHILPHPNYTRPPTPFKQFWMPAHLKDELSPQEDYNYHLPVVLSWFYLTLYLPSEDSLRQAGFLAFLHLLPERAS